MKEIKISKTDKELSKNPTERKVLKFYWYLSFCWEQAWGYFAEPKQLITDFLLVSTFLAVKGWDNTVVVIICFVLLGVISITFGHITLQRGWRHWEASLRNEMNPEMWKIRRLEEEIKKLKKNDKKN